MGCEWKQWDYDGNKVGMAWKWAGNRLGMALVLGTKPFLGMALFFGNGRCFLGTAPFLQDWCCFSSNIAAFPGSSPVIFGMPSRRGTGSRTMIPRSVPTQSEPWHSRRLVTRTSFCPAAGKAGKNWDQGKPHGPTSSRPWGFHRDRPREDPGTSAPSGERWEQKGIKRGKTRSGRKARLQQEMGILWEGVSGSWESNKSRERGKSRERFTQGKREIQGKMNPRKAINPGKDESKESDQSGEKDKSTALWIMEELPHSRGFGSRSSNGFNPNTPARECRDGRDIGILGNQGMRQVWNKREKGKNQGITQVWCSELMKGLWSCGVGMRLG